MARSRYKESIEINLIPYIDILLVLVLILMLTSCLSYQAHNIQLPSTHGQEIDTSHTEQHITLNKQLMVGVVLHDTVRDIGLLDQLKPEDFVALDPHVVYTIDAENTLSYQHIVDLLTLLKIAGFSKVALAMQSQ